MKKEITIPVQIQELKEADIVSAAERRNRYSLLRDLQAQEFNDAIAERLEKEKEKQKEKEPEQDQLDEIDS
jgi:hypothetical protein